MPDIWNKLDEQIYTTRWYLAAFLAGLSFIGGGLYFLSGHKDQLLNPVGLGVMTNLPTAEEVAGVQTISGPLNINTAAREELEALPGIGPVIAQRILDYRQTHGNFKNKEDLQNVKGIGPKTYADLKDKITVQ